jgi:TetR/AcrR family transcriptional repressor of nem operon
MTKPLKSNLQSETRRKLVDAGIKLMRISGYNATTVDDICAEAGVTKGAFFHYFKSKEDIAKSAIESFRDGKTEEFQNASFRQLADPLARVFGRLDFVKESVGGSERRTKGCLIGVLGQELSFTIPELRGICRDAFSRIADEFARDLAAAKAAHAPQVDFDPTSVALLYLAVFQGSAMMSKAADTNTILLANIDHFRRYLHFLFGQVPPAQNP